MDRKAGEELTRLEDQRYLEGKRRDEARERRKRAQEKRERDRQEEEEQDEA